MQPAYTKLSEGGENSQTHSRSFTRASDSFTENPWKTRGFGIEEVAKRSEDDDCERIDSFTFLHDCRFFALLAFDLTCRARAALILYFSHIALASSPFAKSAAIFLLRT